MSMVISVFHRDLNNMCWWLYVFVWWCDDRCFCGLLLSSPEDNVLKVSFCVSPLSVVYCPCVRPSVRASTISFNNFNNRLAKSVETLQGCLLYETLPKLFKEYKSIKNSSCHGNSFFILKKKVLSKTRRRRAFIFCMYHDLVFFYTYCSNYAPMAKRRQVYIKLYQGNPETILLSKSIMRKT